jgi:glycosyltransferase involved in cell wall biosynthesis
MILVLHNRYRTTGGEERAVADLLWLLRERLAEDAELLERDSARFGRGRAAAALLRGGLDPAEVAAAVRTTGARIVHAHNVNPSFGWRALAAARTAGARVVMHLHNYRLVCGVGTCFTRGADCTRCHGRNTLPGAALACRGGRVEAAVYAAGLALWQRRLAACVDVFAVPSTAARDRLLELGAPLDGRAAVVPHFVRAFAEGSRAAEGRHALVASRLAPEKGVEVAVEACAAADVPLVVAGDGPEAAPLRARAGRAGTDVRFAGRLDAPALADLRAAAALAVVPSRSAETFGLAAAEAMADGVPVVASRVGALPELVEEDGLVAPGDAGALAGAIRRRFGDAAAGERGLERARERAGPDAAAAALRDAYDAALARGTR